MFGAATDGCVAQDFEKLYFQYPNARFIWTTRSVESWVRSFARHRMREQWTSDVSLSSLRALFGGERARWMFPHAVIQFGLYLNADSLEGAHTAFTKRVKHFFADKPKHKLLEFDIFGGHGWRELCDFLDSPVPPVAFPWLNQRAPE